MQILGKRRPAKNRLAQRTSIVKQPEHKGALRECRRGKVLVFRFFKMCPTSTVSSGIRSTHPTSAAPLPLVATRFSAIIPTRQGGRK
jgi:hypothetical protein